MSRCQKYTVSYLQAGPATLASAKNMQAIFLRSEAKTSDTQGRCQRFPNPVVFGPGDNILPRVAAEHSRLARGNLRAPHIFTNAKQGLDHLGQQKNSLDMDMRRRCRGKVLVVPAPFAEHPRLQRAEHAATSSRPEDASCTADMAVLGLALIYPALSD